MQLVLFAALLVLAASLLKPVPASQQCSLCELILTELDAMQMENYSIEGVTGALNDVCAGLPGAIAGACEVFVGDYASVATRVLLKTDRGPAGVCSALEFCSR